MTDNILELITKLKSNKTFNHEYTRITGNLTIAEYRGLMAQKIGREMTCFEVSEVMGLSQSRSSRVIENLVKKGYFVRKISERDRRSVAVTLSEKGIVIKEKILKNQQELEDRLQKEFSDEIVNTIKDSLKILLDYFNTKS